MRIKIIMQHTIQLAKIAIILYIAENKLWLSSGDFKPMFLQCPLLSLVTSCIHNPCSWNKHVFCSDWHRIYRWGIRQALPILQRPYNRKTQTILSLWRWLGTWSLVWCCPGRWWPDLLTVVTMCKSHIALFSTNHHYILVVLLLL